MWPRSDGGFHFEDRDAGWRVGVFDALAGLDLVAHAVTTRFGPDVPSEAADADPAADLIARALGLEGLAYSRQVHGRAVLDVHDAGLAGPGDALITNRASLGLMGRSADCPIILLADPVSGVVGMAHASWRGTVRWIAAKLVAAMAARYRMDLSRTVGCICPSAGPCCYEVGPDVLEAARTHMGPDAEQFFPVRDGKRCFDLWSANVHQLVRAGLSRSNVHVAGVCTICRNDLFPSFRVEGAAAGRFAAVIARR